MRSITAIRIMFIRHHKQFRQSHILNRRQQILNFLTLTGNILTKRNSRPKFRILIPGLLPNNFLHFLDIIFIEIFRIRHENGWTCLVDLSFFYQG